MSAPSVPKHGTLLRELCPLFEFQIAFQSKHGRRATDGEHPPELEPLIQVYRKNKAELQRLKGGRVTTSERCHADVILS